MSLVSTRFPCSCWFSVTLCFVLDGGVADFNKFYTKCDPGESALLSFVCLPFLSAFLFLLHVPLILGVLAADRCS